MHDRVKAAVRYPMFVVLAMVIAMSSSMCLSFRHL